LPPGPDMLLGNGFCPSLSAVDVAVVTRSQSAIMHREAELQISLEPESNVSSESDLADKSDEAQLTSLLCLRVLILWRPSLLST